MKLKNFFKIISVGMVALFILSIANTTYAAGNCAFSIGAKFPDGLDTTAVARNAATYYGKMGYSSYYSTEPTFNELNGNFNNGTRRIESDILFLDGHGFKDGKGIEVGNTGVISGGTLGNYVGLNNVNWTTTKLVVYAGCTTALEHEENNITVKTHRLGAKTTLGWHQDVQTGSFSKWLNRFNAKISAGGTFANGFQYANSFNDYADTRVKDLGVFGDWDTIYKKWNRSIETLENPNTINITENIEFKNTEQDMQKIINLIKSINPSFNEDDYDIQVFTLNKDSNFYNIDFIRKIDGFVTELGYNISVNNGKVVSITNNNEDIVIPRNPIKTLTAEKEELYLQKARLNAIGEASNKFGNLFKNKNEIVSQESNYYYDVKTNTKYFRVFSTVMNKNGGLEVMTYEKEL